MTNSLAQDLQAAPYLAKRYAVRVTEDIKFGTAGVDFSKQEGPSRYRDLKLDMYQPVDGRDVARPALIMAFGGAFHRGTRKTDVVEEGEHRNTPVSDYCNQFAQRGYVCFSIDYRLMQEAPDPGDTPTLPRDTIFNTDRVNYVRGLLGFAPCTQEDMRYEIEAATDDMSRAVAFVRARSHALGIDVTRIAIGGFSAGALIALNAAYAERTPAAGVVALSGRISMQTAEACVNGRSNEPALLMFVGENDLPGMLHDLAGPTAHMTRMGVTNQVVMIKGATHFYPRSAPVIDQDGTATDVETLMASFLHRHLRIADM
jgi:dienelactone hydrolase